MSFTPQFSPTAQLHDSIIAQLKALPSVTTAIPADRIGVWYDNKQQLTGTNVRVFCDDDGEERGAVGPSVYTFTLSVAILTNHDLTTSEIQDPLETPHDVHESIVGAIWYAFKDSLMTIPTIDGLQSAGNIVFTGKGSGSDDRGWFVDVLTFTYPYSIPLT